MGNYFSVLFKPIIYVFALINFFVPDAALIRRWHLFEGGADSRATLIRVNTVYIPVSLKLNQWAAGINW